MESSVDVQKSDRHLGKQLWSIRVKAFENDGSFLGSLSEHKKIDTMDYRCFRTIESASGTTSGLSVGQFCIAEYAHQKWGRAKVECLLTSASEGTMALLFFIDVGIKKTKALCRIYDMPRMLVDYAPLLQQYKLKDIEPSAEACSRLMWADTVNTSLRDFLGVQEEEMMMLADLQDDYVVTLYHRIGEELVNINFYLVEVQLAVLKEKQLEVVKEEDSFSTLHVTPPTVEQQRRVAEFQQAEPPKYPFVYVETLAELASFNHLSITGYPPSICRELSDLGFEAPTAVQAYAWPYISEGRNVVMVSPMSTGKTLAYLLPLLLAVADDSVYSDLKQWTCGPLMVVLVHSSASARSVHVQCQKILSWSNASKRFSSCCAYQGSQAEATHMLINGVDVMVCTLPTLLSLLEKETVSFSRLCHFVVDDACDLLLNFPSEMKIVMKMMRDYMNAHALSGVKVPCQVIVASSSWSTMLKSVCGAYVTDPTVVFSCGIEASIFSKVKFNVVPVSREDQISALEQCLKQLGESVVCTTTVEETKFLYQALSITSWDVCAITEDKHITSLEKKHHLGRTIILPDAMVASAHRCMPEISCIIHYSLPSSKNDFHQRLALFYPCFRRKMSCLSTVLLSKNCKKQSSFLKHILEKTDVVIPTELLDLATKAEQEREKRYAGKDLCYHLKAWGECRLKEKCRSPHQLMEVTNCCRPKLMPLPEDGTVNVKVCHVSNATRLWVSLLSHSPLTKGQEPVPCHKSSTLLKLSADLAEYYSIKANKQLHVNPVEGDYCGYIDEEGCYYRVRVLKFSEPLVFVFHHREKARVRLIDIGCVKVVDVNQLLTLPPYFIKLPLQVFEVYICGIKPAESDPDWSEEAVVMSQRLLQDKVLDGNVVLCCDQTLWLDPIEERFKLEGINVTTGLVNPQRVLIKRKLAVANTDHVKKLKEALRISSTTVSPVDTRYETLQKNEEVEVFITAVNTPELFYVQLAQHEEELNELTDKLNSDQKTAAMSTKEPEVGQLCVAKFPIDDRLYRGQIWQVRKGESEVHFADYGDTEWVPNSHIQLISHELLKLPFQAIECSLHKSEVSQWSDTANELLWEWTREKNYRAKIISKSQSKVIATTFHYVVELREVGSDQPFSKRLLISGTRGEVSSKVPKISLLSSVIHQMSESRDEAHISVLANQAHDLVLRNPSIPVSKQDVEVLFNMVGSNSDLQVCVLFANVIATLVVFQPRVQECVVECSLLNIILPILEKSDDSKIIESILVIVRLTVTQSSCSEAVLKCCVMSLCSLLKKDPPVLVFSDVVKTLVHMLQENYGDRLMAYLIHLGRYLPLFHRLPSKSLCSLVGREVGRILCRVDHRTVCSSFRLLSSVTCNKAGVDSIASQFSVVKVVQMFEQTQDEELAVLILGVLNNVSVHPDLRVVLQRCIPSITTLSATKGILLHRYLEKHGLSSKAICKYLVPEACAHTTKEPLKCLLPNILWSQQKNSIRLRVLLCGCDNPQVEVQSNTIHFHALLKDQPYHFDLNLYDRIIPDSCVQKFTCSEYIITVCKKTQCYWPALVKEGKLNFIRTDFDHLNDMDEDEMKTADKPHKKVAWDYSNAIVPEEDTSSIEDDSDNSVQNMDNLPEF